MKYAFYSCQVCDLKPGVYNLFDIAIRIMITFMKYGRIIDFLLLVAIL